MNALLEKKHKPKVSALAHSYLDGLAGIEIGGSAHNTFGLNTKNVDLTDDMTTVFKRYEVERCGVAMPVDIVAPGDRLPIENSSVDFVISSHVIEHFFDPISAIEEWLRVSKRWIFIICPQPNALLSDIGRPLTPFEELELRHRNLIWPPEGTDVHFTVWTAQTFVQMCQNLGWVVEKVQDPDDKAGNGFTIVIDVIKTKAARSPQVVVGSSEQ
jgi:SAM-dependent methyltransferase